MIDWTPWELAPLPNNFEGFVLTKRNGQGQGPSSVAGMVLCTFFANNSTINYLVEDFVDREGEITPEERRAIANAWTNGGLQALLDGDTGMTPACFDVNGDGVFDALDLEAAETLAAAADQMRSYLLRVREAAEAA